MNWKRCTNDGESLKNQPEKKFYKDKLSLCENGECVFQSLVDSDDFEWDCTVSDCP